MASNINTFRRRSPHEPADRERAAIRARWPDEFRDGARCGLSQKYEGPREAGGYPKGFHTRPLDRRNSWFAGYNYGRMRR